MAWLMAQSVTLQPKPQVLACCCAHCCVGVAHCCYILLQQCLAEFTAFIYFIVQVWTGAEPRPALLARVITVDDLTFQAAGGGLCYACKMHT